MTYLILIFLNSTNNLLNHQQRQKHLLQTLISHAQDNIMIPPQSEETSQIETSSPRCHENTEEPSNDLHTVRNFIHTIITLSQDFLTSLDDEDETLESPYIMTHEPHGKPNCCNSKPISCHNLLQDLHQTIKTIENQLQSQLLARNHKNPKQKNQKIAHVTDLGHLAIQQRIADADLYQESYFN